MEWIYTLKMFRNTAAFVLMNKEASPSYNLQLLNVFLKTGMINVDSGILINHAKILKDEIDDKWSPILKVLVQAAFCFIFQNDVNGYYDFQIPVEDIELYVNGESIPSRPMEIDVRTNRHYVTPFVSLFEVAEK